MKQILALSFLIALTVGFSSARAADLPSKGMDKGCPMMGDSPMKGKCPMCVEGDKKCDCPMAGMHGKPGMPPMHGMHMKMDRDRDEHGEFFLDYAKDLELTDVQTAKLNGMRVDYDKKRFELEHRKYMLEAEFQRMAHDPKPVRKKLSEKAAAIGKLEGDLAELKAFSLLDARAALNEKQQKKLDEIFQAPAHDAPGL
jgi:Spy/CpxP family protein refolding chaperone